MAKEIFKRFSHFVLVSDISVIFLEKKTANIVVHELRYTKIFRMFLFAEFLEVFEISKDLCRVFWSIWNI